MEEFLNIPDNPKVDKGGNLWKTLLLTFLGTTMSILLTFGSSQLVAQHRQSKDRKMTVLMVMGSVEKFAQKLDQRARQMENYDTMATYLLKAFSL